MPVSRDPWRSLALMVLKVCNVHALQHAHVPSHVCVYADVDVDVFVYVYVLACLSVHV